MTEPKAKKLTPRQEAIAAGRVDDVAAAEIEARTIDRLAGGWKEYKKVLPLGRWVKRETGWAIAAR